MKMNPHFDYFSLNSNQDMPYNLNIPSLSQPRFQVSRPRLDYLNQSKTNSMKTMPSFDGLAEPNKRIRLSHQSFAKIPSNIRETSHSRQVLEKANFARDQLNLTCKDDLSSVFAEKFGQTTPSNSSPIEEELIIPGLNRFTQDSFQGFSLQAYQRMLQQLEQKKAQFYVQQQLMMQIARQQAQNQFEAQQLNSKVVQIHKEAKTGHTVGVSEAKKEDSEEDENNFEYIQIENSVDTKASDDEINRKRGMEKAGTESKSLLKKEKVEKPRRNKNEQYWEEYSRMLGNNIYKTTHESRHQNKWQAKKESEIPQTLGQENGDLNVVLPLEDNQIKKSAETVKKPAKTEKVEIPQHMEDDSMVDYETLISMTITNDPVYTGTENSRENFVVINKSTNPMLVEPHDTRVGDRYQVSVPQFKGPVVGKKRNLKTTWRPEIVKKNDLKAYFDELCHIFGCEQINQQEALRLLKSKKYRKEGVVGNIGKNRKYYAKILMAPDSC